MSRTIRQRVQRSARTPPAAPPAPNTPPLPPVDLREAAAAPLFDGRLREALAHGLLHAGDEADATPLTVPRAWSAVGPGLLAGAHPGTAVERLPARARYERCLQHYRSVVRAEDQARGVDDLGAAFAHFVAAAMRALQGCRVGAGTLKRLEQQLVAIVRGSPAWAAAGLAERQAWFEQAALLSVLVGDCVVQAAAQGPAAVAAMRQAARGCLRRLVGIDPEMLALGADGLRLAPDPADAPAAAPVVLPWLAPAVAVPA